FGAFGGAGPLGSPGRRGCLVQPVVPAVEGVGRQVDPPGHGRPHPGPVERDAAGEKLGHRGPQPPPAPAAAPQRPAHPTPRVTGRGRRPGAGGPRPPTTGAAPGAPGPPPAGRTPPWLRGWRYQEAPPTTPAPRTHPPVTVE